MLGLGSSLTKSSKIRKRIVRNNLVLKHDYNAGGVEQVSTGAAFFTASGNDYITINNNASLNPGTGSFSISCWVNSNQKGTSSFVVGKGDNTNTGVGVGTGFALYLGNTGSDWVFWVGDGSQRAIQHTSTEANANQWYHLCGTFDTSGTDTAKLYVDGVLIGSNAQALGDIDVSDNFDIGRIGGSTSYDWDGYICNVGFWKGRVLSQAEIKSIMWKNYADLTSAETTSLSSWWNLDSTIGESATTATSTRASTFVLDNHGSLGDEIMENFGFEDSSQTGYTTTDATYEYVSGNNGLAVTTTGTATGTTNQKVAIPMVSSSVDNNKKYLVSFDIVSTTQGSAGIIISGATIDKASANSHFWYPNRAGSYSSVVTFASSGTTAISLHAGTAVGAVTTFDNLSFKEITGNTGILA